MLYDYPKKRVNWVLNSMEHIRLYDQNIEYSTRIVEIDDNHSQKSICEKAYLNVHMPLPSLPPLIFSSNKTIYESNSFFKVQHWIHSKKRDKIHFYFRDNGTIPVSLIYEHISDPIRQTTITYTFSSFQILDEKDKQTNFQIHDHCKWSQIGFPYLFLFHHYVRI